MLYHNPISPQFQAQYLGVILSSSETVQLSNRVIPKPQHHPLIGS